MQLTDIMGYENIEINLINNSEWLKTEILKATDKMITIALPSNLKNFFVSDEVKCKIADGPNMYIFGGEISDVIFKFPQSLVIFVPGQIKKLNEFRKEKRYYTSLMSEIFKLKKFYGCVKDISRSGICLHSKGFLENGDDVGITIFFDNGKNQLFFEGIVVRKKDCPEYKEYGIEIENIASEEEDKYINLLESLENG